MPAFQATVLTLFPEMFPGPLAVSLAGKALAAGIWSLDVRNIRDWAHDRHRSVDDRPAGGGPGMVLKPDVLAAAIDAAAAGEDRRPRLLMSARGEPLTQQFVRELAEGPAPSSSAPGSKAWTSGSSSRRNLREVSIGDFVLSGGEPAAMALLDAVVRLLPGVMGDAASGAVESFAGWAARVSAIHAARDVGGRGDSAGAASGRSPGDRALETRGEPEKATRERRPDLWAALRNASARRAKDLISGWQRR